LDQAVVKERKERARWRLYDIESKKKLEPGHFAEGPRNPGFVLPASAVSEQEDRHFKFAEAKSG
jgi:hypothetical protein